MTSLFRQLVYSKKCRIGVWVGARGATHPVWHLIHIFNYFLFQHLINCKMRICIWGDFYFYIYKFELASFLLWQLKEKFPFLQVLFNFWTLCSCFLRNSYSFGSFSTTVFPQGIPRYLCILMFGHLLMCWYFFYYLNVLILRRKISSTTFFVFDSSQS